MEEKNNCPKCGYELVLKDYGESEMKDCFLSNEKSLDKNKKPDKCSKKYFCYKCDKFVV